MGSIYAALLSAADAMRVYDKRLSVIQNNVANVDTPGYVQQNLQLLARRFDPNSGLAGGVDAGGLLSTRDRYLERSVWQQQSRLGSYSQKASQLEQLEPAFSVKAGGLPEAINRFFASVSSLTVNPNDPVARQVVLDRASALARSFRANAAAVGEASNLADRAISDTVDRINALAGRVRTLNEEIGSDFRKKNDAGLDARMHEALEELAGLVDFTVLPQDNGTVQLMLGGQVPLVIANRQYLLKADVSGAQTEILLGQDGRVVTAAFTEGALTGQLDLRNRLLPSYVSDLNKLASSLAGEVNAVLVGGLDAQGFTPAMDLFTYDGTAGAAATFTMNPLEPYQLAAASTDAPGGNGNALALAALAHSKEVDGSTFSEFYGKLGARVGRDIAAAREGVEIQEQLVSQARELRASESGVSLDAEAAKLIEVQRAYQANMQLFRILNELTDEVVNLLR